MRLEAKNISFRYYKGSREILNSFSLKLESGERMGLEAPSGFGKTTCCKILAGYEKPDGGEVTLDGRPLAEFKGFCPVQMIWQHPELAVNPRLKMRKILEEGGPIERRITDGLGIEPEWMERYPAELSGGELQRFCIARALGEHTRFLLCDEISTMLDFITQSQIWNFLVKETAEREIGMLVVSHSEALLEKVCTGIQRLDKVEMGLHKK